VVVVAGPDNSQPRLIVPKRCLKQARQVAQAGWDWRYAALTGVGLALLAGVCGLGLSKRHMPGALWAILALAGTLAVVRASQAGRTAPLPVRLSSVRLDHLVIVISKDDADARIRLELPRKTLVELAQQ
jgi:hypothetical protein